MNALSIAVDSLSAPSLRDAMRLSAAGVAIVTAGEDDERAGMTVTSAMSLSVDPPTMIVCVNRNASTLPVIRRRRHFCVNLLAAEHEDLADRFTGRGGLAGAARYAGAGWRPLTTGALALDGALAAIDCALEDVVERHSHVIVIGAVRTIAMRPGEPLVYNQGRYRRFAPL